MLVMCNVQGNFGDGDDDGCDYIDGGHYIGGGYRMVADMFFEDGQSASSFHRQ